MGLDVRSALVCDLVRTEDTGKQIIVGVYVGAIGLPGLPVDLPLTFWVELRPFVRNGDMVFESRIDVPGSKQPAVLRGSVPVGEEESVYVITTGHFHFTEPGRLVLSMRPGGGRWTRVLSKDVVLSPAAG